MLEKKYSVEHHRENWYAELHNIEANITAAKQWLSLCDCLNGCLEETERAAREVHHDVGEAPADGRLALVIKINLWHVFYQSYCSFSVTRHAHRPIRLINVRVELLKNEKTED